MPNYGEYLFTPPYGDQVLRPDPSEIPEGWTASEHFRSLPGDIAYGVPVTFPGPDGWGFRQLRHLRERIHGSADFNDFQQRALRELIARCLPHFQVCGDVSLTADDIRTKTGNFHKHYFDWTLYGEYKETPGRAPLMLALDAFTDGTLVIFGADFHRDYMPEVPVTPEDYLQRPQEPVPSQD